MTGRLVEHGRRLLSAKYSVTESDWMSMLIANPFIPNGHHEIIAKGLHQGFNSEWIYPTHLLPPQFEASMRHVLRITLDSISKYYAWFEAERLLAQGAFATP